MSRYKAYPEYTDSGVEWIGEMPSHWAVCRIKNIATINPAKSAVRALPPDTEVSFIPMEAIGEKGELDATRTMVISEVIAGYSYVADGDLMIAKITPCFENGKGAIASGLSNGIGFATTEIINIRPAEPEDSAFLFFLLSADPFRKLAEGSMYGAGGQKRVADSFVAEYHLAFPGKRERKEIATFLDHETAKIDSLIKKQQRLIELLKEKRQAVISHAVTKGLNPNAPMKDSGVDWLGEVPAHWNIKKFNRCASIKSGQVDPTKPPFNQFILIAPNHIESGTGKIISLEAAEEQGADSGKYLCKKGDVIYSKIRPALAKVCISPSDEVICSADMYPISASGGLLNEFLYWSLLSNWFTSFVILESDRVAMPKINREKLAEIFLPTPPEQEQREISSWIRTQTTAIDSVQANAKVGVELLQERRTALISAAVTGKIDVRDWQAAAAAA